MNIRQIYGVAIFLLVPLFGYAAAEPSQSFVMAKKKKTKLSIEALKESLGQAVKGLFDVTAKLECQVGELQLCVAEQPKTISLSSVCRSCGGFAIALSGMQSRCSNVIESLVDNAKPFKKAKRNQLEEALTIAEDLSKELSKELMTFVSLGFKQKGAGADALTEGVRHVNRLKKRIEKGLAAMNKTTCLWFSQVVL